MEQAVKCTELNTKIFGFADKLVSSSMDLWDVYHNKTLFDDKFEPQRENFLKILNQQKEEESF